MIRCFGGLRALALVGLDLDATIPTLLVGDFNLHSPSWSPMGWDTSRGAHRLEEWAATQTLELLSKPRIPTRMGEGGGRNSTLDLAWCNMAALIQGTFVGVEVDFGSSQGSDHALIRTIASTPVAIHRAPVTFFLLIIVHITDYHWDRHLYFVIHSHHAQTMTHTPPSDDSYTSF
jgi:hypothetical protein